MRGGYFGTRPFGVPGWHRWCSRAPSGRVAVCARGRRPARSPSAPRASLGASSRSPARPCRRPRTPRPCPPHRQRCVVVCGGQALPPPTDTAAMPPGSPAPSALRTHVVSCVADPGGKITIRTVGIVLREVSDKGLFAFKGVGGVGVGRSAGGGVGGVPIPPPVGPMCAWRGVAVSGSVCQFRVCSCLLGRCTRSVGNAPLLFGCTAT